MRTFILTAGIMIERAVKRRDLQWVWGLSVATVLILGSPGEFARHFVSLAAFLPVVFLLTDWPGSQNRRGLMALLCRTQGGKTVSMTELLLPWAAGTLLSSAAAIIVDPSPPWQFWLASPFTVLGFSLLFLVSENRMRHPGRAMIFLVWLYGTSRQEACGAVEKVLLFTGYPGGVLVGECPSGTHPDTYIMASLALVIISGALAALCLRERG